MVKKILSMLLFFTIVVLFELNIVDVMAVDCDYSILECVSEKGYLHKSNSDYTVSGDCEFIIEQGNDWIELDSYNSGTSSSFNGGNEDLQNWDGKNHCPNVIRIHMGWEWFGDGNLWYGYDDLDSARDAAEDYDYIFVLDDYLEELQKDTEEFDREVSYTCTYDGFYIEYNKEGYALKAESTNEYYGVYSFYDLSERMRTLPAKEPGVCENVYKCISVNNGTSTMSYMLFTDSLDFEADGDSCQQFNGNDGSEISDDGDNPTCRTMDTEFAILESYFNDCDSNKTNCSEYTHQEIKLKTWCKGLYNNATYSDECVKYCLHLDVDIAKMKIGEPTEGEANKCSVSGKVINWIMKIIRWIRYIVPILLILLSIMDFIKAVASDSEDEMKKVGSKFVKRLIVAALIFLIPLILEFLLGVFDISTQDYCLKE